MGSADAEKGEGWEEDSQRKKILTLPSPSQHQRVSLH